ncbi:hypothetical protein [Streptomyces sp. Da 82-17]|uniref:hypothetical protein n=1 Tax=Streptomyces sp. Da 82-17 TaxID=3377116 RepID=UPI0038D41DF5
MPSESGSPFGDLVREALQVPEVTLRSLADKAVDPETGEKVGHTTFWKISKDEPIKVSPPLVRAVAVALGKPAREVQVAAAQQYVGLIAGDPVGASGGDAVVAVVHAPGMTGADMPKVQALLRRLAAGELPDAD